MTRDRADSGTSHTRGVSLTNYNIMECNGMRSPPSAMFMSAAECMGILLMVDKPPSDGKLGSLTPLPPLSGHVSLPLLFDASAYLDTLTGQGLRVHQLFSETQAGRRGAVLSHLKEKKKNNNNNRIKIPS